MVDFDQLAELMPHYLVLLVIFFVVIGTVRWTIGDLGIVIELAILLVISFSYPSLVRRLGVAPSVWER